MSNNNVFDTASAYIQGFLKNIDTDDDFFNGLVKVSTGLSEQTTELSRADVKHIIQTGSEGNIFATTMTVLHAEMEEDYKTKLNFDEVTYRNLLSFFFITALTYYSMGIYDSKDEKLPESEEK